jgi:hypothetical protein
VSEGVDGVGGVDKVDGVDRIGRLVVPILAAAALAGCWHVGASPSGSGAPDAGDADTDADSDSDPDSDSDSHSDSDSQSDSQSDWVELLPGFEESLATCDGCSDVLVCCMGMYGDGDIELVFYFEGLAMDMFLAGWPDIDRERTLPDAEVTLEVRQGLILSNDECVDDVEPGEEPVVWRTYAATSGQAYIRLHALSEEWSEWDLPAEAYLELNDVVFAPSDGGPGDPVLLPHFVVEGVSVGWFPG